MLRPQVHALLRLRRLRNAHGGLSDLTVQIHIEAVLRRGLNSTAPLAIQVSLQHFPRLLSVPKNALLHGRLRHLEEVLALIVRWRLARSLHRVRDRRLSRLAQISQHALIQTLEIHRGLQVLIQRTLRNNCLEHRRFISAAHPAHGACPVLAGFHFARRRGILSRVL